VAAAFDSPFDGPDEGYLAGLNPVQREAATHSEGPLLIVAGAGSGKTRVLTHRIAYLLAERDVHPGEVLAITFTNKAAGEMKERVGHLVGARARFMWVSTFHSACVRILRAEHEHAGLKSSFSIYDQDDSRRLMQLVARELDLDPKRHSARSLAAEVSNLKNELIDPPAFTAKAVGAFQRGVAEAYALYQQRLREAHSLDFDDLIMATVELFKRKPDVVDKYRRRFRHVLVDEYQDTNALQASILLALRPGGSGLTVVGDDAQSIYSFRSASVRNILQFPAQFSPPATTLKLEQNYRSTAPILDACNRIIARATEGYPKKLFSRRGGGDKPIIATVADERDQADFVVSRVLANREAGMDLRAQAVLMRASHHSIQLEIELARRNIPFVKFGGLKFLEAAHIKDVVSVLRWADNPRDQMAALRVLKLLPGIGAAAARRAFALLDGSK
jgi:DNA helicase-2/ATP-dependent DNA helicase PcrA